MARHLIEHPVQAQDLLQRVRSGARDSAATAVTAGRGLLSAHEPTEGIMTTATTFKRASCLAPLAGAVSLLLSACPMGIAHYDVDLPPLVVRGHVVDREGRPLEGEEFELFRPVTSDTARLRTSGGGSFSHEFPATRAMGGGMVVFPFGLLGPSKEGFRNIHMFVDVARTGSSCKIDIVKEIVGVRATAYRAETLPHDIRECDSFAPLGVGVVSVSWGEIQDVVELVIRIGPRK